MIDTFRRIISEFDSFPSISEILRVKRQVDDLLARPIDGRPVEEIEDIPYSTGMPWWWKKGIAAIKAKGDVRKRLFAEMIEEAKRRGEPESDWQARHVNFATEAGQRISWRLWTQCGWCRWVLDDKGQLPQWPDRWQKVIVSGSAVKP